MNIIGKKIKSLKVVGTLQMVTGKTLTRNCFNFFDVVPYIFNNVDYRKDMIRP